MNVIMVISDTFRYDNLSCYGSTRVQTPSLDRLAAQSHVFTNAYLGSFPTIPNRLEMMSGRFTFIDHEWCPLPAETVTLQQILSASGVTTQLVCDNPHLVEMGFNYERGFDGWDWIRGQETDHWRNVPKRVHVPDEKYNRSPWVLENYLRNVAWWKGEEDRFVARSVRQACDWLGQAAGDLDRFFLHLDLFDPHEPWDAPQHYLDLYDPGYTGADVLYPHYGFAEEFLTPRELLHARARYMAESTMVDHWIGVLLDRLDDLGLTEDTAVIFTSDHGFLLGEHGLIGKSRMPHDETGRRKFYESVPLYDELRRIPLIIRLPGQTKATRIPALVQPVDLMPTILEMAGLVTTESIGGETQIQALQCGVFFTSRWRFEPAACHGRSLMPLMRGETTRLRDIAVASNTIIHKTPVLAKSAIVTEDGWCLHYSGVYDQPDLDAFMYTTKLINPAASRIPTAPALFYLPDDPHEEENVIGENEAKAGEIHARYVAWLEEHGAPPEHLEGRRRLR